MKTLHQSVTKKQCFILLNVAIIGGLILTGRLTWTTEDVVITVIVLLVMNGVAAISARNYPDWK